MLSICWYTSKVLWDQWFYSAGGDKLCCWSSKELHSDEETHGTLVQQVKEHETWQYKSMSVGRSDAFEFLTNVEAMRFAVGDKDVK